MRRLHDEDRRACGAKVPVFLMVDRVSAYNPPVTRRVWLLLGFFGLAFVGIGAFWLTVRDNGDLTTPPVLAPRKRAPAPPKPVVQKPDPPKPEAQWRAESGVFTGDGPVQVRVTGARANVKLGVMEARSDYRYVVVSVAIANRGTRPQVVGPDDFQLTDRTGFAARYDNQTFGLATPLKADPIAPGAIAVGQMAFYVPKAARYVLVARNSAGGDIAKKAVYP